MINRRHVINDNEIDSPPPLGVVTACELLSFGISPIFLALANIIIYRVNIKEKINMQLHIIMISVIFIIF